MAKGRTFYATARRCFVSIVYFTTPIRIRAWRSLLVPSTTAWMSASNSNDSSDGKFDDVVIPHREHGYATKPLSWDDLVQIIQVEENLAKLSRSLPQERVYQRYRKNLLNEYQSVYDHILISKFNFERRKDKETGRIVAYPPLSEFDGTVQTTLVPNDFPYCTEDNIEHWILWQLGREISHQDVDSAMLDLRRKLVNVVDILYWRNPPHLKSLPDIDHVHFLCKRKPGADVRPNAEGESTTSSP